MNNITFKITEKDIKEYLKNHKSLVMNKEAMFVKYIKENKEVTIEALELLVGKYNFSKIPFLSEQFDLRERNQVLYQLPDFDDYLKQQTLDLSGLYHIIIPAVGLYQKEKFFYHSKTNFNAYTIAKILDLEDIEKIDTQNLLVRDTVEDYMIANQIQDFGSMYKGYSVITMGREKCRKSLTEYEKIYGKENVQKVRKLVRERCVNNE